MVTQNMIRMHEEKYVFSEGKKTICDYSRSNQMPDKQIEKQRWLLTCSPISKLPANISTMLRTKKRRNEQN